MITKIASTDPVATYNQAIRFLEEACEAIDQAHACLKDVDMDQTIYTRTWGRFVSVLDAVRMVDKLLEDARGARCDDCGQLLAGNARCLRGNCLEPDDSTEYLNEF
jgi:hypothetical protein